MCVYVCTYTGVGGVSSVCVCACMCVRMCIYQNALQNKAVVLSPVYSALQHTK